MLVHGAWHGGWCWRRVSDLLEKKGHKVFTPTMTGVGERSHLMSKDIVLDTHITDLVNVFKWEDLKDVCLVVHSYGGWPGSGALEQIGDRVSSIVWLDAFKPENGQRGFDFASEFSRKAIAGGGGEGRARAPVAEGGGLRRQREGPRLGRFQDHAAAQRGGAAADQAHRRAREGGEEDLHPRRRPIRSRRSTRPWRSARPTRSWRTFEATNCGHDVMVDEPEWLVGRSLAGIVSGGNNDE